MTKMGVIVEEPPHYQWYCRRRLIFSRESPRLHARGLIVKDRHGGLSGRIFSDPCSARSLPFPWREQALQALCVNRDRTKAEESHRSDALERRPHLNFAGRHPL